MERNNRHNRRHHWNNNKNQNKNNSQNKEQQVQTQERKFHFVAHEDIEAKRRREQAISELKEREVICPICNEKITDVASAIADKTTGNPVHFECVMNKLSETEKCGQNEKICYIGQGRFGILYFENLRRVHQDTAVDLHIVHFGHSLGEFSVHRDVRCGAPAVIDPVAVLNHCRSLRGCHQFLLIFFRVTHFSSSDLILTLTALFRRRFFSTSAPKYRIVILYNNCKLNSSKNSVDSCD